jgi:hypothetical protein
LDWPVADRLPVSRLVYIWITAAHFRRDETAALATTFAGGFSLLKQRVSP